MAVSIEKSIARVVDGVTGFTQQAAQRNRTIIVSDGEALRMLADEIARTNSPVTIIDSHPVWGRVAVSSSPVEVIQGDPTDVDVLKQVGTQDAAFLLAATPSNEVNLDVCKVAEMTLNPIRLITRVNNKKNSADFELLGYEVMSLARAALTLLKKPELTAELRELLKESDEDELLAEISLLSPVILGRALSSISMNGCTVVELKRGDGRISFDEATLLQIGDSLTLFGSARAIESASAQLNPQC